MILSSHDKEQQNGRGKADSLSALSGSFLSLREQLCSPLLSIKKTKGRENVSLQWGETGFRGKQRSECEGPSFCYDGYETNFQVPSPLHFSQLFRPMEVKDGQSFQDDENIVISEDTTMGRRSKCFFISSFTGCGLSTFGDHHRRSRTLGKNRANQSSLSVMKNSFSSSGSKGSQKKTLHQNHHADMRKMEKQRFSASPIFTFDNYLLS